MQLWAMGIPQPDIQLRVVGAIASQTTLFYIPETHLQDPTAWRHQKGMQEQSNISPNNQAIHPLGGSSKHAAHHKYATLQANVAQHFPTSTSCIPSRVHMLHHLTQDVVLPPMISSTSPNSHNQKGEQQPKSQGNDILNFNPLSLRPTNEELLRYSAIINHPRMDEFSLRRCSPQEHRAGRGYSSHTRPPST